MEYNSFLRQEMEAETSCKRLPEHSGMLLGKAKAELETRFTKKGAIKLLVKVKQGK